MMSEYPYMGWTADGKSIPTIKFRKEMMDFYRREGVDFKPPEWWDSPVAITFDGRRSPSTRTVAFDSEPAPSRRRGRNFKVTGSIDSSRHPARVTDQDLANASPAQLRRLMRSFDRDDEPADHEPARATDASADLQVILQEAYDTLHAGGSTSKSTPPQPGPGGNRAFDAEGVSDPELMRQMARQSGFRIW